MVSLPRIRPKFKGRVDTFKGDTRCMYLTQRLVDIWNEMHSRGERQTQSPRGQILGSNNIEGYHWDGGEWD